MTAPSTPYPIRFVRTPGSTEAYEIAWVLNPGDVITVATWTCDAGLQIVATQHSGTTTTVTLAGGLIPTGQPWWNYHAVCSIVTAGGMTDSRTIVLFTKPL